jgi:signal transduction histidine kinase
MSIPLYGSIDERLSNVEMSARTTQRLSMLGEMAEGIAHDFRNILTVVDSGLRLAERSYDAPEQVRACITGAHEGIVRGFTLTSQLLTFAKQRQLDLRICDPNALLRDLESFLKYGAGPEVRVVTQLSPDIANCLVDLSQFAAAILNLVFNARDAMPRGGTVHISTVGCEEKTGGSQSIAPGTYVRIRVRDEGLGMSHEVIERISEPFFTTKGRREPVWAYRRSMPSCGISAVTYASPAIPGGARPSTSSSQQWILIVTRRILTLFPLRRLRIICL